MKQERLSQNKRVLQYLRTHKRGISDLEAYEKYAIRRLSARIYDLRKMGYEIETIREIKNNRFGVAVTYARYILED